MKLMNNLIKTNRQKLIIIYNFSSEKSSRMDQQQMDIQRISNLSNYSGNSQSHSRELNAKTQEMSLINTAKHLCGTQGEKKNGRGKDIENVEEIFNWFQEKGIYSGNPCELYERYTEQCREKIRLELKKSQITEDEPKSPSKLLMSRKTSIISNLSVKL